MSQDQEAKAIEVGQRVKAFLEDPDIKRRWIELEKRYFGEFKKAKTPAEREALHARCLALDEVFSALTGLEDDGKLAQAARDQRVQAEERAAARRNPRHR